MFTGIITDQGTLLKRVGGEFEIACHYDPATIELGASIACDGCCLTVIEILNREEEACSFKVDVSPETIDVTTLANWVEGQKINLERALKMGDEFGGHIVSGHVDGKAVIRSKTEVGNSYQYQIEAPEDLKIFIAAKGSVTLNGVSLTVNEVDDNIFGVNIIPHTYAETTWHHCKVGDEINIEVDMLARYAIRASQAITSGNVKN